MTEEYHAQSQKNQDASKRNDQQNPQKQKCSMRRLATGRGIAAGRIIARTPRSTALVLRVAVGLCAAIKRAGQAGGPKRTHRMDKTAIIASRRFGVEVFVKLLSRRYWPRRAWYHVSELIA